MRVLVTARSTDIPMRLSVGVKGRLSPEVLDLLSKLVEPYWSVENSIAPCSLGMLLIDFDETRMEKTFSLVEDGILMSLPSGLSPVMVACEILSCCRLLMKTVLIKCGGTNVHCSGFTHDGNACLISGPRFMGKTTAVLNLLKSTPDTRFLANDQVILLPLVGRIVSIGFPSLISIRDDDLLAELSHISPLREFARSDGASDGVRREFSVDSIAAVLGFPIDPSGAVKFMVELNRCDANAVSELTMKSSDWITESNYPLDSQHDTDLLRLVGMAVAQLDFPRIPLASSVNVACRLTVPHYDFEVTSRAIFSCFERAIAG